MGLFSGARSAPDAPQQRAFTLPWGLTSLTPAATLGNFAQIDANGENALRSVAVGTAIDLICSVGSELPIDVFRGEGAERVKITTPGNLEDPGGDGNGREDWAYQLLESWLYRGNAYGEAVEFDGYGRPRIVSLFHPDEVSAIVTDGRVQWRVNGQPVMDDARFFHRRVNPMSGRLLGMSVIERHALTIGTSLASGAYGSQWFQDGAHPSGMLVNSEQSIDKAQAETVKARWMSLFQGTREPAVMGKGWTYQPLQMAPEESQFLETQRFSEAQCARMFGPAMAETLGYETGGSMTYANVVDRRSDLLTLTLNRWLRRLERVLTQLVPERQYVRINRDAFLQSTTLARYEAHASALGNGWRSVNEIRDIEELPPVPWGEYPTPDISDQDTSDNTPDPDPGVTP